MDPLEISILATRDRDSDVFSPGVPNIGTLFLKEELMDRCHDAFNDVPIRQTLEDNLQRIVNVAQLELKAERAALFRPSAGGNSVECAASVNLTRTEMQSPAMRDRIAWIADCLSNGKGDRDRQAICLSLNVGGRQPWLLYLDTRFGPGFLTQLKKSELGELARLFAAEVRTALRLDDMLQQEIHWQNAKFNAVTLQKNTGEAPIIGEGLKPFVSQVRQVGMTDAAVLLYGETGAGKDVIARQIHLFSQRKGPFVAVHPASTPEQLFESEFFGHTKGAFSGAHANKEGYIGAAHNGTLFLDEIGELPIHLQVKLLRAIENKMYTPVGSNTPKVSSFRLVAATNQDLSKMVLEKKMRSDFYYRVHVLSITLPPLRERHGDIPLLVEAYMERKGISCALPLQVRLAMEHYDWPGNVRELHNFLDRYTAFGDVALESLGDAGKAELLFPALHHEGLTLETATLQLEERLIRQALERCRWRRGDAAEALGLNLRTLQRKMKRLGMGR